MFYPLALKIYLHTARKLRFEFTIFGHTREAGVLQSLGSQRVRHNGATTLN